MHIYGVTNNTLQVTIINECISLDIKGPIKSKHFRQSLNSRCFYILVITVFSRYTEPIIIYNIESTTISAHFLKTWIRKCGALNRFITDNGRQLTSEKLFDLVKKYSITYIKSEPK